MSDGPQYQWAILAIAGILTAGYSIIKKKPPLKVFKTKENSEIIGFIATVIGAYKWFDSRKLTSQPFDFIAPPSLTQGGQPNLTHVQNYDLTRGYTSLGIPTSIQTGGPLALEYGSTPGQGKVSHYYPDNETQIAVAQGANIPANWHLVGGYNSPESGSVSAGLPAFPLYTTLPLQ